MKRKLAVVGTIVVLAVAVGMLNTSTAPKPVRYTGIPSVGIPNLALPKLPSVVVAPVPPRWDLIFGAGFGVLLMALLCVEVHNAIILRRILAMMPRQPVSAELAEGYAELETYLAGPPIRG